MTTAIRYVCPITKIISGGQTGADQGGLAAGKQLGIKTSGTAPPGFMTDDGLQPALLMSYGLVEGNSDPQIYPKRTKRNVLDSHGTVVFGNSHSPGSKLTLRYCDEFCKPSIINPDPTQLLDWIYVHGIHVLNVAGNRERTNPGIFERTKETIIKALRP